MSASEIYLTPRLVDLSLFGCSGEPLCPCFPLRPRKSKFLKPHRLCVEAIKKLKIQ
jgi:hypothetical protein